MSDTTVTLDWAGRPTRIECRWVEPAAGARPSGAPPLIVFLHEGLGSVAMWKDFPQVLCDATGARGLVYSRPGYGRSSPHPHGQQLQPDFMHRQADTLLPALLAALGVDAAGNPPWLYGHSDGGSIALLHAARFPGRVAGLVVAAPHIRVEDLSLRSIAAARAAWAATDLPQRLSRYHDDAEGAFRGWNDVWLDERFRDWNIEETLGGIACPVLAIQGLEDEYGTLEQIRGIARRVPGTELLELPRCGHSPHRDRPAEVIAAVAGFMHRHAAPSGR